MSLSKTPRFSEAELEMLRLWSLPDVSGVDDADTPLNNGSPPPEETEPTPILTVEEIEAMQKQAYDESFVQGEKEGFQQGYEQGLKKGYQENEQLVKTKAAELGKLLAALSEPFKLLDDEVEKELVKLALAVATQIIRREIKLDPGQVVAAVKQAIQVLPLSAQKITLYLHPEDADLVRSAFSLDDLSPAWTVTEDPLITRGGCKVDTDVSHIDATVENRLAAVVANLLGGEREHDSIASQSRSSMHAGFTAPGKGEIEHQMAEADEMQGAIADDCMDAGDRAMQGAIAEDKM